MTMIEPDKWYCYPREAISNKPDPNIDCYALVLLALCAVVSRSPMDLQEYTDPKAGLVVDPKSKKLRISKPMREFIEIALSIDPTCRPKTALEYLKLLGKKFPDTDCISDFDSSLEEPLPKTRGPIEVVNMSKEDFPRHTINKRTSGDLSLSTAISEKDIIHDEDYLKVLLAAESNTGTEPDALYRHRLALRGPNKSSSATIKNRQDVIKVRDRKPVVLDQNATAEKGEISTDYQNRITRSDVKKTQPVSVIPQIEIFDSHIESGSKNQNWSNLSSLTKDPIDPEIEKVIQFYGDKN